MVISWGDMMLRKILAMVCILISIFCCGCSKIFATFPSAQPGTTWSTDDGKVSFYVGKKTGDPIYGYIETQDGPVEIILVMSKQVSYIGIEYLDSAPEIDDDSIKHAVEIWHYSDYSNDSIEITVFKSEYFDVGQKLVLFRRL